MSAMSMSKVAYRRRVGARARSDAPTSMVTTIDRIVTYIPTEVTVLYTALLAALSAGGPVSSGGRWAVFWFTLGASPIVVWLLYAARVRAARESGPLKPRTWPLLEMTLGTIAFATWAFALPESPFNELAWYSAEIAAAAMVVVTTAIGLVAPALHRPLPTS